MPIPTPTANAALSIVTSLVRLAGRIDGIMAEQAALREDLAFAGKVLLQPPLAIAMVKELKAFLAATAGRTPDPLSGRREELEAFLRLQPPPEPELVAWMEDLVPEKLVFEIKNPDADFARKLESKRGAWNLNDQEIRRLVYYLEPGADTRQGKLPWKLAMSVVEALTDIAVANQDLLLREDRARPLVVAVLERFATVDLAAGPPQATLRLVLKATLNGALDAAGKLDSDKAWVNGLLSALAKARAQSGDDFVVGLIRGRGYPLLVGQLLEEGGLLLRSDAASDFELVAADVLGHAGKLIVGRRDFEGFFQEHWGDLLRAGLRSVHSHGNAILSSETPLLRETLLAVIDALAASKDAALLGSGTLIKAVEAGIAVVAAKPELLKNADQPWLRSLLASTAAVVADRGIRSAFSTDGLHSLVQAALTDLAAHPELLIENPGLPQQVLGAMLGALASGSSRPQLETVAAAGVTAVLGALAANPALAKTKYPDAVARIAGALAKALDDLALSSDEARELLGAAASSIAANPAIVGADAGALAGDVLAAVFRSLVKDGRIVANVEAKRLAAAALDAAIANPGLLAGKPALVAAAIEPVLRAVHDALAAASPEAKVTASSVAATAARAVLVAVAADPNLLGGRYPDEVGRIAALLAQHLADGKIGGSEANGIALLAAKIVATNADFLAEAKPGLASEVLSAALKVVLADGAIRLRGGDIAAVAAAVLGVLAAHGKALLGDDPQQKLAERVAAVIDAGLREATERLGVLLDRGGAAAVLVALLRRWALDRVPTLDPADPRFERVFAEIVGEVLDRAA